MSLKKIDLKQPKVHEALKGELCPSCEVVPTEWGCIPCPDGRPGCCVAHFGWRCPRCGNYYQKVTP